MTAMGCGQNTPKRAHRVFLVTPGAGTARVPLPVPPDPTLRGAQLAAQFAVSDPGGGFQQVLSLSPGLRIVVSDN
jgi:hypothetical protein